MWRTWKSDPTEENLEPLLTSLQPLVNKRVAEFSRAPVPPGAVRGQANLCVMRALNSYDPNKGAALGTHVHIHLKKVSSFVAKHQNLGRIPEHRVNRITDFKNAKEELTQQMGHPPDALSLAEHLGPKWSINEVSRMEAELRPDLISSKGIEPDSLTDIEYSRDREVLRYIYQELTAEERAVFEYSHGINGKPELQAGEIANVMGISQPKVSRIRRKIDLKLQARGV
jgi:DNA-directed RNA polymerase sigma subunit (sigma70/sigma32)